MRASDDNPDSEGWIVAFVHPNSLITATSRAGMRAVLRDEFTSIYVVNLRGDAYKSGEEFKREGEKIFGSGSRNGVQITVLVRNPDQQTDIPAILRYAEVQESLTLEEKFKWLKVLGDVTSDELIEIPVNKRHEWTNIGEDGFEEMLAVCDTNYSNPKVVVKDHASGAKTNCDVYVYSFSREILERRVQRLINLYEAARSLVHSGSSNRQHIKQQVEQQTVNDRLDTIKWTDTLKQSLRKGEVIEFDPDRIREVLYRPFTKLWLYEDHRVLTAIKTISAMFPADPDLSLSLSHTHTLSAPRTTWPSPESSPQISSAASTPSQPGKQPESYRGGDADLRDIEHAFPSARDSKDAGLSSDQGITADASATEAIIVTGTSNGGRNDSVVATTCMPDLNSIGPGRGGGRVIPVSSAVSRRRL